jgi:hypothetical protein
MRDNEQKLHATQESGRKDTAKDLSHDGQVHAPSKQGHSKRGEDDPRDQRRTEDRKPPR